MNAMKPQGGAQTDLRIQVANLLFRFDPVGLAACGVSPDEYELEAGTIVPRLASASSVEDVHAIVFAEFLFWFGSDARDFEQYQAVAKEIWGLREATTEC